MADYLAKYTDQQVEEFAKKIAKVYAQAAKEIQEKYDDYAAKYAVKDQKKFADYLAGKITLEKYQSWLKGQVFIGKQWEQKVKDITTVYLNADKKAYELLSDTDESVFTEAANHSAYEIEQGIDGAISFDLFDKETVKRLMKDNPKMLPEWKIDQPKNYIWNEERVQNAVAQAIIQGEKIPDIAKRLGKELATSNAKKMVLFARTATNGAQNAGRIQRMHETADMGLDVRKEWIAASDSRVRDTHRELNGQICKEGEKFKVGTQEIEYPGDPTAAPALVYNCRCSLGFVYPKYNKAEKGLYYIGEDGQKHEVTDMTYKEWTAAKEKEKADKEAAEKVKEETAKFAKKIEFTDVFTENQQRAVIETIQMAQSEFPLPYQFDFVGDGRISRNLPHVDIWELRDEYPERRMDFGEAAQYISIKKPNGDVERRIDLIDDEMSVIPLSEMYNILYKSHKAFEEEPGLSHALFNAGVGIEGTVLHEYGHAVQDYYGFFLRQTHEGKEFEDWIRNYSYEHPTEILSISRYAGEGLANKDPAMRGVLPSEVWAEAFTTYFDPHHDTMAWKTANDIMSEFKKRFILNNDQNYTFETDNKSEIDKLFEELDQAQEEKDILELLGVSKTLDTKEKEYEVDEKYGQFGLKESAYPKELKYTAEEQEYIDDLDEYWHDESGGKKNFDFNQDVSLAVSGTLQPTDFGFEHIKQQKEKYEEKLKQAEEMIAQRKKEGYKGASRAENWQKWKALKEELKGADEFERGDYLKAARVGEQGIRYWQIERKKYENKLKQMELAEKVLKRQKFAKERR